MRMENIQRTVWSSDVLLIEFWFVRIPKLIIELFELTILPKLFSVPVIPVKSTESELLAFKPLLVNEFLFVIVPVAELVIIL